MRVKAKINVELEVILSNSEEKQIVKIGSKFSLKLELEPIKDAVDTKTIQVETEVVDIRGIDTIIKQKGKKQDIKETRYDVLLKIVKLDNSIYSTMGKNQYIELYIEDIIKVSLDELLNNDGEVSIWTLMV